MQTFEMTYRRIKCPLFAQSKTQFGKNYSCNVLVCLIVKLNMRGERINVGLSSSSYISYKINQTKEILVPFDRGTSIFNNPAK